MHRRDLLAALAGGGLLAGCLGSRSSGDATTPEGTVAEDSSETTPPTPGGTTPEATATPEASGLAAYGVPSTICSESIKPESGIYAVTDPAFAADWSTHEVDPVYQHDRRGGSLVDEQTVIGVTAEGRARAYPLTVLTTHEAVNDDFGGPLLVTFCPLCSSGMVADRRVAGEATPFAVTGLLWKPERIQSAGSVQRNRTFGASYSGGDEASVRHNGNLVLYDAATGSYWSQILARGICGPRAGTELAIRPSSVASWGEWRERHPDTEVLLPPPHSETVAPGQILGDG